ncbi:MAG: hypothetical protein GC171_07815 [Terrimonas sp.]|nr:hypothetical protein [Terrimonas sp.]
MKKNLLKSLKISGIILFALVLMAFATPFLFKKKIIAVVKNEINNNVNAKVDFSGFSISLFRHFPQVSLKMENLYIRGAGEFEKDTLMSTKDLDLSVNLISFFKGSAIRITAFELDEPRFHLLVNKDGRANWDITKTSASGDTSQSEDVFKINLAKYTIKNGYLFYQDVSADMQAEIINFYHKGSGDLMAETFQLATQTQADAVYFNYGGIPYLSGNKTTVNARIDADINKNKYGFQQADIQVNNLKLSADGFFQLENDSTYNMDLQFASPSNDFKDILSLIPAVYKKDFATIKTSGTALFKGFVKGRYSPQQMPAYDVDLQVNNGSFQYPDLPKPVQQIQLALKASNPDGLPDHAVIDISKGHIEMDNKPFDFRLLFRNPETVQYLDAAIKGNIDLAEINKFIKLENNTKLSGLLAADAFAKGNLSAIQQQEGAFSAGGFFNISRLFYSANDFPEPIQNGNIKAAITNKGGMADQTTINIPSGHIELGKDPFDFAITISNPVTNINFDGSAKGSFSLNNIQQFTQLEKGTSINGLLNAALAFKGNRSMIEKNEYDKLQLTGDLNLSDLRYTSTAYPSGINIKSTKLLFNPANISLNNLDGNYLGTHFSANGTLDNLLGYLMGKQTLNGVLNASADQMNLNDWMGTGGSTDTLAATHTEPFLVPANINLILNARAGSVRYDKVAYNQINGRLVMADETIKLENVKTSALDGDMTFNGSYATKDSKKDPAISIQYDINNVDVQKAFFAFNTIQQLMPIGQFIAGRLSSELSMTGHLNGSMVPEINTLTGKGNFLLIEGVLSKFKPLEKIAGLLQIDDLKGISLKDIKNYIEFANGKVLVKPFTVKVKDIEMEIGGLHGIDQSIDYIVQMKVPRKYLGTQGNSLINDLAARATAKGIPVKLEDIVNLTLKVGGSISNPTVSTELKDVAGNAADAMKEQATAFAQQKIDSAKNTLKDSANSIRKEITNDLKNEIRNQLFGKDSLAGSDSTKANTLDNGKKKAEQTIKNTFNKLLNKKKNTPADTTKNNFP